MWLAFAVCRFFSSLTTDISLFLFYYHRPHGIKSYKPMEEARMLADQWQCTIHFTSHHIRFNVYACAMDAVCELHTTRIRHHHGLYHTCHHLNRIDFWISPKLIYGTHFIGNVLHTNWTIGWCKWFNTCRIEIIDSNIRSFWILICTLKFIASICFHNAASLSSLNWNQCIYQSKVFALIVNIKLVERIEEIFFLIK